jgi:acyl-CoA synthetase (AMP-forming)/AMP-acid ligase II
VFSPTPKTDDILDTIVSHKVNRVNMWQTQRKALFDRAAEKGINLATMVGDITEPRDDIGNIIPMNRRVTSILGMTESFGPHGVEWRNTILPESRAGSLGHAIEGIERRIVDQASGAVLQPGETGELQIRGFTLMQGYYKKARDEVFTRDGWFSTGDLCHLDADGYIYFHGRRSEMIKSMGANIAPREVELQLESLPGVREAIVFGVPDEKRGESVMAVVVPLEGQKVDGNALRAGLKDRLSSYKVPDDIIVARFEDIPRTDSGKSKKNELRKILPALKAAAAGKAAAG